MIRITQNAINSIQDQNYILEDALVSKTRHRWSGPPAAPSNASPALPPCISKTLIFKHFHHSSKFKETRMWREIAPIQSTPDGQRVYIASK